MTGHFCGGRTHLLTQRNGGGGWGGQDGRRLKLREQSLLSWHAQPRHPLPTASPSREREEPERHKGPELPSAAAGGLVKARCALAGVGGTSCGRDFLCGAISGKKSRCGPGGGGALRPLAGFPRLMVPAGLLTRSTSLPSQPISLFLASNEAINELYRSLKLSLELDG